MKNGVYSILKARFLINEEANAAKNWRFIVFLIILAIVMIANTQRYEQKVFRIVELTSEVKELRSEFVDRRSELMKLKMESYRIRKNGSQADLSCLRASDKNKSQARRREKFL